MLPVVLAWLPVAVATLVVGLGVPALASISLVSIFTAVYVTVLTTSMVSRRVFFHPLSKFPGPWKAAASKWRLALWNWDGRVPDEIQRLHETHDIVRIVRVFHLLGAGSTHPFAAGAIRTLFNVVDAIPAVCGSAGKLGKGETRSIHIFPGSQLNVYPSEGPWYDAVSRCTRLPTQRKLTPLSRCLPIQATQSRSCGITTSMRSDARTGIEDSLPKAWSTTQSLFETGRRSLSASPIHHRK